MYGVNVPCSIRHPSNSRVSLASRAILTNVDPGCISKVGSVREEAVPLRTLVVPVSNTPVLKAYGGFKPLASASSSRLYSELAPSQCALKSLRQN